MQRDYRFVGGPWHGERRPMDGRLEWLVPISDRDIDGGDYTVAAMLRDADDIRSAYRGIKCAVYRLVGDYEAERFYQFLRVERR